MSVGTMDIRWKGVLPEALNVVLFLLAFVAGVFAFSAEEGVLTDLFQIVFVVAVNILGFNAFCAATTRSAEL